MVITGLNDLGDVAGYYHDTVPSVIGQDGSTLIMTRESFAWRPGGRFIGGLSTDSELVSVK